MSQFKGIIGWGAGAFAVAWLLACGGTTNHSDQQSSESWQTGQREQPSSESRQTGQRDQSSSESGQTGQREHIANTVDENVAADIIEWLNAGRPALTESTMHVGAIGSLSRAELVQIVDSSSALATIPDRYGFPGEFFFIRGFDFTDNVDGQKLSFPLLRVVGTERYMTPLGVTKQVFMLEGTGVDLERFELELVAAVEKTQHDEAKRLAAEREERRAALHESQFRTWTSADGTYTVEARLAGFAYGRARLEKRSGEVVEVPGEKLSEADRDYISKEFDRRR